MDFIRRLRPGVQRGEITCSIRIWKRVAGLDGHPEMSMGLLELELMAGSIGSPDDVPPPAVGRLLSRVKTDILAFSENAAVASIFLSDDARGS